MGMLKAEGLEYEARGDGEAVLLIHGALIADALFPLMGEAALADRHRLICYRRKGHGGSDPVSVPQASNNRRRTPRRFWRTSVWSAPTWSGTPAEA